ncbi:hypothetical protein ATI61_101688 [Archangium gephyra]|uniref:Lipoprotein n=1 Tax=Archangium gephyra TaxID=48 RepID=A0AAC8QB62_9BACT|nr:hypothetical protein [Archangium gephyra]AKJ04219.1 Hypothetical protein AA314_05845 [Archangium gephyra]REG37701.1 hypothetical protein ATI61_101688 [Archangium gephyra]
MRALLLTTRIAASVLLAAACGGKAVRPEGAPSRVVVVGASVVPRPAPRGFTGDVFGSENPRDVVAREGAEALRTRGYEVLGVELTAGAAPTVEQAAALAREYRAEAAVVLVLTRLDLSAMQPLGRAEIELESMMVGPDGRVLSSDDRRSATSQNLYRARTDWRSHVRQAVIQAVRELP